MPAGIAHAGGAGHFDSKVQAAAAALGQSLIESTGHLKVERHAVGAIGERPTRLPAEGRQIGERLPVPLPPAAALGEPIRRSLPTSAPAPAGPGTRTPAQSSIEAPSLEDRTPRHRFPHDRLGLAQENVRRKARQGRIVGQRELGGAGKVRIVFEHLLEDLQRGPPTAVFPGFAGRPEGPRPAAPDDSSPTLASQGADKRNQPWSSRAVTCKGVSLCSSNRH